jgi:mRNA interferase RelE/StbE
MYKITFKRSAEKEIQKLPSLVISKIVPVIESLSSDPRPSGSKKLQGSKENIWRVRVGNYRVVYLIADEIKIVEIRKIGHRKDIYK